MGRHGIGKRFAAHNAVTQIARRACGRRNAATVPGQAVERRAQRHAGRKQIAEFRREHQHFARLHAVALFHLPPGLALAGGRGHGRGLGAADFRHGQRRVSQLFHCQHGGTPVRRIDFSLDTLAIPGAGSVVKIRHNVSWGVTGGFAASLVLRHWRLRRVIRGHWLLRHVMRSSLTARGRPLTRAQPANDQ